MRGRYVRAIDVLNQHILPELRIATDYIFDFKACAAMPLGIRNPVG